MAPMPESRVLVAGASGLLGSVIVKKLLAAGVPVRALGRDAAKLAPSRLKRRSRPAAHRMPCKTERRYLLGDIPMFDDLAAPQAE